ncbi:MAG TPA: DMT family transporter [Sulfuricurvum sp.]|nr:MAG: permease [Campylobacterales bacterium 16-40-21]OZA02250.1 MAG: permease [Sulfuricurvum sp. 17-40-25]HQS67678.1 DMT family transporter [Sulfuricurvum sp.]HQT37165.1 DMT family transporter [Sulfuricurvum sp.]
MNPLALWMIFSMMLWGAGWPVLKILSQSVSWEVATFWRLAIMSLAYIPVLWWTKKPFRLDKSAWMTVSLSGFLYTLFMVLSFLGVHVATAGAGGMIITTLSPILIVIIAIVFTGFRPSKQHIFGLGLGLLGGMIMVELWEGTILSNIGNLLFIFAAVTWSILSVLAQHSRQYVDPIRYSFFLGLVATLCMFFMAYGHGILSVFDQGFVFWSALLYLSVMTQTVATTIYFIASTKMGSGKASSYMLLVPVFALVSSYEMLGEVPAISLVIGGALSIAAVYWINHAKAD